MAFSKRSRQVRFGLFAPSWPWASPFRSTPT